MPPVEVAFEEVLEDPPKVKSISSGQITVLLRELKAIFESRGTLIRLADPRPAVFVGDTHGDLHTTSSIATQHFLSNEDTMLIFLGDYVDRGLQDVHTFNFVSILKLLFPERVVMLRGNHENEEINRRTYVIRIFPNAESCLRLVRALAVELHENWIEATRYLNMDLLSERKKEELRNLEPAA